MSESAAEQTSVRAGFRAASRVMGYRNEALEGQPRAHVKDRWVAIVDDHRSVRSCLTRVMRLEGIRAAEFASAEEYLDHSAPTAPCCVVLDVQLPGMSGYELAELLERERPPLPPIIFISAHEDLLASIDGEGRAHGRLRKPFEMDALLELVKPLL